MVDCSKICKNFDPIDIQEPEPTPEPEPIPEPTGGKLLSNGKWFKRDGKNVYMAFQSDPEYWIWLDDWTRERILANTLKFGGNALALYSISTHGGDAKHLDRTDMNPFHNHDPEQGVNLAVLEMWYEIAKRMDAQNKILIFNFRDDETRPWGKNKMMVRKEQDYIRAVIHRFQHIRNLVWMVAEEYNEIMSRDYAREVAWFLKDRDPHPVVIHQTNRSTFDFADDKFKDGSQLFDSFFMQCTNIQGQSDLRNRLREAVGQAAGRYNICMFEGTDKEGLRWGHGSEAMRWAEICAEEGAYFGWYDRGENGFTQQELEFLEALRIRMEKEIN